MPHAPGHQPYLKSRCGVWKEIVRYIQKDVGEIYTLVELGTGYCDFINQFPARQKIGYDIRPEMLQFAGIEVDLRIESAIELSGLRDNSVDLVFAEQLHGFILKRKCLARHLR